MSVSFPRMGMFLAIIPSNNSLSLSLLLQRLYIVNITLIGVPEVPLMDLFFFQLSYFAAFSGCAPLLCLPDL